MPFVKPLLKILATSIDTALHKPFISVAYNQVEISSTIHFVINLTVCSTLPSKQNPINQTVSKQGHGLNHEQTIKHTAH